MELPLIWDAMALMVTVMRALQWRHNKRDGVSNLQCHDCKLKRLFRCRSKKTSKLRVTGFCAGDSPVTGELPAQRASNAGNVSIWWRHHDFTGRPFETRTRRSPVGSTPHKDQIIKKAFLCRDVIVWSPKFNIMHYRNTYFINTFGPHFINAWQIY